MFSNMSARVWNAHSNKIDSNTSKTVFKDKLKLFLLDNELVLSYPKYYHACTWFGILSIT